MHGGVDCAALVTGTALVQQSEAAADHRVTDLAHRQRARHGTRPPQPYQSVLPDELVDHGAAIDPVDAGPQRDDLGVAQQISHAPPHHHPLPECALVALRLLCGSGRRAHHRPLRQQVPRPLAGLGVGRVLLVDRQFVADGAVGDELAPTVDE